MIEKVKKIIKGNKKETLISIVALLFIIIAVVGITYAAFSYTKAGTKSNKVTTSTITMNYNEATNGITLTNAFPMSDNDGKVLTGEGNTFGFTVTVTTGNNTPVGYEISAVKDSNSTLSNNDVRIYLEKSTSGAEGTYSSVLEPTGFSPINATTEIGTPAGEMLLHSDSTTSTRTDYYILRMWIRSDYEITGESKFFTIKVNVYGTDSHINTSEISLNKNSMTLDEGESEQLSATVLPDYATNKNVTWESSNTDVAVVDSNGNVTAQSITGITATATITATDSKGHSATCTVTVNKPEPTGVEIEDNILELNLIAPGEASGETTEGSSTILEAGTTPANANSNEVEWTTSDSDVLDIEKYTEANASGTGSSKSVVANKVKVTAKGAGTATLTVKSASNSSAPAKSITVTIQDPESTGLSIDKPVLSIDRGSNTTITATLNLSNSRDKTIYWTNSDSTKASINCTGGSTNSSGEIETTSASVVCTVTGLSNGSTTITATDSKGHTATSNVTVRSSEVVSLSMPASTSVTKLSSTIFEVSGVTSDTQNDPRNMENIVVTSSNLQVAANPSCTYSSTTHKLGCEVTGLTAGNSTITASVGSISTTMSLTVNPLNPSNVSIEDKPTDNKMIENTTHTLSANVEPAAADDKSVTWTSSDTSIATVTQAGVINAIAPGTTTITATTNSGSNITDSFTLTVVVTPPTCASGTNLSTCITNWYNSGKYSDTMIKDSDNNIRYTGTNPNNYITFNGETWRIIGLFGNNVKIIRASTIGSIAWDTTGSNNWRRPATLRTLLNGDYYNSSGSYTSNGLGNVKSYIQSHSWNVGIISSYEVSTTTLYNTEKATTDTMNVGLITASEDVYTSSSCYNTSNIRTCGSGSSWLNDMFLGAWNQCSSYGTSTLTAFYKSYNGVVRVPVQAYRFPDYKDNPRDDYNSTHPVVFLVEGVKSNNSNLIGKSDSAYTITIQ